MIDFFKTKNKCRIEVSELETEIRKFREVLREINNVKLEVEEIIKKKEDRARKLKEKYSPYFS